MRILLAAAALGALALSTTPANAVTECFEGQPCFCGTEISVGVPGKDPIISGNIDC